MSNQEAINIIKYNLLDCGGSDGFSSREIEALNKAIDALQKVDNVQSCLGNKAASAAKDGAE